MAKSKSSQGASGARRKPAPSLYQHISSFKPQFSTRVDDVLHFSKTLTWRSEIIPDKSKGTLTTSLLYSQGSDIYEIDTTLPLKTSTTTTKKVTTRRSLQPPQIQSMVMLSKMLRGNHCAQSGFTRAKQSQKCNTWKAQTTVRRLRCPRTALWHGSEMRSRFPFISYRK